MDVIALRSGLFAGSGAPAAPGRAIFGGCGAQAEPKEGAGGRPPSFRPVRALRPSSRPVRSQGDAIAALASRTRAGGPRVRAPCRQAIGGESIAKLLSCLCDGLAADLELNGARFHRAFPPRRGACPSWRGGRQGGVRDGRSLALPDRGAAYPPGARPRRRDS